MGLSVCWEYSRKSCPTLREKERKNNQIEKDIQRSYRPNRSWLVGKAKQNTTEGTYTGSEKPGMFLIQGNRTLQILLFAFIRKPHGGKVVDHDPRGGQL